MGWKKLEIPKLDVAFAVEQIRTSIRPHPDAVTRPLVEGCIEMLLDILEAQQEQIADLRRQIESLSDALTQTRNGAL
jgi:hypothetical protein